MNRKVNVELRPYNTSKVYRIGKIFESQSSGAFRIIGQTTKYRLRKGKYKYYENYLIEFETGYQKVVTDRHIKKGTIKDPYKPLIYDVGYVGRGVYQTHTNKHGVYRTYNLWKHMLERCYSPEYHIIKPTYIGCTVHSDWHNYQVFCDEIQQLEGYTAWANDNNPINAYQLDKDIKIKGNKLYSKDNCMFVTKEDNSLEAHLSGCLYEGHRLCDGYKETFINQTEFAEKYNLQQSNISLCILTDKPSHKGWTFKIISE